MEPRSKNLPLWITKLPTPRSLVVLFKHGIYTGALRIQEGAARLISHLRRFPPEQSAFATLFYASPIAICICTAEDRRIIGANDSFAHLTGYTKTQVTGRTWREIGLWVDPDDDARMQRVLAESGAISDIEIAYRPKQGEVHYALVSAEPLDWRGQRAILMLAYDITERKRVEERQQGLLNQVRASRERLQALSKRLLDVQENERRQIARELHDEIGQTLTGLRFVLEAASRASADRVQPHLDEAQVLVNELIARVRNLSLELRPAMLDDLGLLPALLWLFERYTHQTQIRVEFGHNALERRFPPELETAAFRIIQEALTNVERHARESEVAVRAWTADDVLHLQVEDWGAGFDVDAVLAANRSGGLSGMRERASWLGGRVRIESVQGVGTRVHGELPLSLRRLERRYGERNDSLGG